MQQSLIMFMWFLVGCAFTVHAAFNGSSTLSGWILISSVFSLTYWAAKVRSIKIIMFLLFIPFAIYFPYESGWLPLQIMSPGLLVLFIYLEFFRKKPGMERQEKN